MKKDPNIIGGEDVDKIECIFQLRAMCKIQNKIIDDLVEVQNSLRERLIKAMHVPVHVISTPGFMTDEQHARLTKQIDDVWPKHLDRPILLEGLTLTKVS